MATRISERFIYRLSVTTASGWAPVVNTPEYISRVNVCDQS